MTNTYLTGNPLGSTAPKDLFDNASNFDEGMNSELPSFYDRFGKRRETWAGMEKAFDDFLLVSGYEFIGDYDADGPLTITQQNQVFTKDGEYWRSSPALALPYITVNNWVTDQPKFVSVGDAQLRQSLANSADPVQGAAMVGRSTVSIESVFALLSAAQISSQVLLIKGYLPGRIDGGGVFRWNSGRLKSAHDGGKVISPTVPWDGTTGAPLAAFLSGTGETSPGGSGCWERLGAAGRVDPLWYGALGDYDFNIFSGTENVVPFQKAAAAIKDKGGVFHISSGRYLLSDQVEFALPLVTDDFYRVSIQGEGPGASELVIAGLVGFRFTGGTALTSGVHSYQSISGVGFRAVGGTRVHTAIAGDNLAYMSFEWLRIENFEYAFNLTDFLSSEISNCVIRGNRFGLNAGFADFSRPNAVSVKNSYFLANSALAIVLGSASVFTMSGGSVEGNGLDVGELSRGGILLLDPGSEGAVGATVNGVYFEANGGAADFFSTSTGSNGLVSYSFVGNSFNRLDVATCTTNNIRIDSDGKFSIAMTGNGHKGFLTYSPNVARKYVAINPAAAADAEVIDGGNFYADGIEAPVYPGRFVGRQSSAAAYVRFNGSGGGAAIVDSYNIASVTRLGVGIYRVTYSGLMNNVSNTYSGAKGSPGFSYPVGETTAYVDFTFTDAAGAPHDVANCHVLVHGA